MSGHALLITDVVDSTQLVERMGDIRTAELWAEYDRRARDLLLRHNGKEISRTDGFLLLFDDAHDAAAYAVAYHRAMADLAFIARAGLHVGPVHLRKNADADIARGAKPMEVEGLAKPFAARLMALARGGQTLLSEAARNALRDRLPAGADLESHGHYRLKGIEEPVEVFELGARDVAPFAPPPDAEKAYRVVRAGDLWRPVREVRHNLPAERDSFVGRSDELRELAERLDAGARLLTVLGPGGSGKTRFVRRYGWTWLGDWPGGAYFCDLSEARSLDGIYFAVASALEVPLGRDDPGMQLGHAIAGRGRCLIIVDNFEQVVAHAAATLGRWLDRAVDAAFVVTSRERLHLAGEGIFSIEPLALDSDAIELFVTRARAQRHDFALSESNRAAVAEVVRLLDGLPLAIELAAARARVLSPAQLVERLRDRFQLLAGARGAAARQATLRAAIDWSWDLLTPWEQAALAQCAVFEGGFTLEAAEAVIDIKSWPQAPPALDAVQALVDKSLLRTWVPAEQGRYEVDEPYFGMYVSIREYAAEKLRAAGGAVTAEVRHGSYFARFGMESALDALHTHGGVRRLRTLALEIDNLVVACRRALTQGNVETAVATYRAACKVLDLQGPISVAIALGTLLLTLDSIALPLRAAALPTLALALWRAGRVEEAAPRLEQALAICRETHERRREGSVLDAQGTLHREQGRPAEAQSCFETALAIQREVANRREEGMVLGNFGTLTFERGQAEKARDYFIQALAIHREVGNRPFEGVLLGNLGVLDYEQGRMDEARRHYEAAIAVAREIGDRRVAGSVRGNLALLHLQQGRLEEALAQVEAAIVIHRTVGNRRFEGFAVAILGDVQRTLDRITEARTNYETALAIHKEVGNRRFAAMALSCLGDIHRSQGRVEEARKHYEQALATHREIGSKRDAGIALGVLADLLAEDGRIDDARTALAEGEALLEESDNPMELAKLFCIRGRIDVMRGELDAARGALRDAEAVAASTAAGPQSELAREIGKLQRALSGPRED